MRTIDHDDSMRMASVLSGGDLPTVELQIGVLDGELQRLGDAFCTIDTVVETHHRATSIALNVAPRSIAERFTAAWVYGVVAQVPRRWQLCVDSQNKVRPFSSHRYTFREVVILEHETNVIGGLLVTTPLRTALDIVRTQREFSPSSADVVRKLAALGPGFTLAECREELSGRKNLPHKQIALERLTSVFG